MRAITVRRVALAGVLALLLGAGDDGSAAPSRSGGGAKIALLLPENKATPYEAYDRPGFQLLGAVVLDASTRSRAEGERAA